MDKDNSSISFRGELFSLRFLCIPVIASIQQLSISFFQMAAPRLLSETVADSLDTYLSLAFVPCLLIGAAIDILGIHPILCFMNTLGLLTYACTLGSSAAAAAADGLRTFAVICFCGYVSLDSELIFCCVSSLFKSQHFGRLAGISQASGGLISLIAIPLYDAVSVHMNGGDCKPVACCIAFLLAFAYPIIIWLGWGSLTKQKIEQQHIDIDTQPHQQQHHLPVHLELTIHPNKHKSRSQNTETSTYDKLALLPSPAATTAGTTTTVAADNTAAEAAAAATAVEIEAKHCEDEGQRQTPNFCCCV